MNKKILVFSIVVSMVLAVTAAIISPYLFNEEISADLVANVQTGPRVQAEEEKQSIEEPIVVLNSSIISSFEDDRENIIRDFQWLEKALKADFLPAYRQYIEDLSSCRDADFDCLDQARFQLDDLAKEAL